MGPDPAGIPDPGEPERTILHTPFEESADEAAAEYQTGSDYPAVDGDDLEEDIYGENDPFPDEDGVYYEPRSPTDELRAVPRPAEVTRIAPAALLEDEEDEDDDDPNATRAGPPIHLEVLSGPDQGRTKRFRGVRMVVGRTEGCDFKLTDNSVSRRHLELVVSDRGVMLRDLGSGNGTRVNGQRVNEKLLQDGDEIAIGQTRFRFVDELSARKKKEAEEAAAAKAAEAGEEDAPGAEEDGAAAESEEAPADVGDGDDEAPADEEADEESGEEEDAADEDAPKAKPRARRKKALGDEEADRTNTHVPPAIARRRPIRGGRSAIAALTPKQKLAIALGAGALGLMVLLVFALVPSKPPPPPPDPNAPRAAAKLQEARNALREEKFEQALALIAEAERLEPGVDSTGMAAAAQKELEAQKAFAEVRALIAQNAFDEAREKLKAAPSAVVINEARRKALAEELDAAENAYGRKKAEEALDAQDVETAEAILAKLPPRMAEELRPRLEEVKAQVEAQKEAEAKDAKAAAAAAARRAKAKRQAYIEDAFMGVARKFNQGEYARAALECDRVVALHPGDEEIRRRARDLKKWMPQFGRYLDEGQRKYRQGALESAARPLMRARELYAKIGFEGALGAIIDEQLAGAALAAGKAALQRNDLGSARNSFRLALQLNPGETRAQRGLDTVAEKAEQLYLEGYMIRDREPREAAAKFRAVMDALPTDSPTWEKAKSQLERLGQ
ncbi:MAG: FHA domain-containing protein [Myxococcaceae bacterium]|nr:FHA domain-containing protein [Myxococcaceae bacterium]